ncbi:MAG: hypothetical protein HY556_05045 [Euryarchaeota archaeon]|nr:hypothetical protein [Euryarchaeota archaeon]
MLTVPFLQPVLADGEKSGDDDSSGSGSSGRDEGESRSSEGRADGRSEEDEETDREIAEAARDHAEERKNFTEEQRLERQNVSAELNASRDACKDEGASDEEIRTCEELNREARETFLRAQRDERRAFEEQLREEFKEILERVADQPHERVGHFNFSGNEVTGRYITFSMDLQNATISTLTVSSQLLLDGVAVSRAGEFEGIKVEGADFRLEWENAAIRVHDNPAIALRVDLEDDAQGIIDFADYLNVTRDEGAFRATDGENLTATLRAAGNVSADGAVYFDDGAKLVAHSDQQLLKGAGEANRPDIEDAKTKGRVGAEITILKARGIVVDSVVLDDVTINFSSANDTLRFVTAAQGISGKVFVINVDRALLRADELVLRFYDEVGGTWSEVPIIEAQGGLVDVLDATDDSTPEYWIVKGDDGWQVLVSVNHWSVHAFTIESMSVQSVVEVVATNPSIVVGLAAGVLVSAAAAFNLFRPRRP